MLPRVDALVAGQRAQPAGLADAAVRAARRGRLVATAAVRLPAARAGRDRGAAGERARRATRSCSARRRRSGARAARWRGGRSRRVEFLRKLFCLTPGGGRLRRRRGRGATPAGACGASRWRASRTIPTSAAARGRPRSRPQAAGEITISTPSRLRRVLDQAARRAADPARAAGLLHRVRLPDEPARPHLRRAARRSRPAYLNQSDWMAYRDPRVRVGGAVQARRRGRRWRASSPGCGSSTGARSRPTTPTGCRSGCQRARLAAAGLRPGAPGARRDARRSCGSRCARRAAARSRPSGRSRCARATASSSRACRRGRACGGWPGAR